MTLGINKFTRCVKPLFHRSSWSTDNTMTKSKVLLSWTHSDINRHTTYWPLFVYSVVYDRLAINTDPLSRECHMTNLWQMYKWQGH